MLFLTAETRSLPFRRPLAVAAVLVIGTLAVDLAPPPSEATSGEWDYRHTPRDLPTLKWAATPPAPEKRIQNQPLDMSYPEVAALLGLRMSRWESPEKIRATAAQIIRLCHLLGFQPSFILAVIEHESSFKSRIVSPAGAMGLMQLLPATARIVGSSIGISVPHGGANLRDPVINVTLGMHYLAQLQDDFKTLASTLAAYNLGPQRWVQYLAQPGNKRPRAVAKYVALIERTTRRMREGGKTAWKAGLDEASSVGSETSSSAR